MRRYTLTIVVVSLCLNTYRVRAQWIQTNGISTGVSPLCFAVRGTNLFAGTNNSGVFLSSDSGASWTQVNSGLINPAVYCLAVSGADLFAGTWGSGVFLSTNNGTSWTAVNTGLTNTYVNCLAFSGTNLLAGTAGGVFISANNGTNWTAVNTGLTDTTVLSLAVSGTNLFAGTNSSVFLSSNNGASWTAAGMTNNGVGTFAVSDTHLFGGTNLGVFLSTDNGTTWTSVNTGLTNTTVLSFDVSGTNLFVGTYGGVFLSTDNGTSWISVNTGFPNNTAAARSLIISGTNLFAGNLNDNRVWRRPLSEMTTGADSQISITAADVDSNYFAVGSSETTYVSLDTAVMDIGTASSSTSQTWTAPSVTFTDSLRTDNIEPSSTPFASYFPKATYAREFSQSAGGSTTDTYLYFQVSNDSISELGLGEQNLTTDSGFVVPFNHAMLYLPLPLQLGDVYTTAYDSTNLGKGNTMATSTVETIDAYGTLNLPGGSFGALRARGVTTTRFYARFIMVYDTTTYTISWYTKEGYGLTVGVDSGSAGIASVNSVTVAYPGKTPATLVKASPYQPHNFVLAQNYPDPFNPTTVISYKLSALSNVTLKVYDVLGREVATLVNQREGPGNYSVTFDGSQLASGVYFYRLTAGDFVSVKKLVLVK